MAYRISKIDEDNFAWFSKDFSKKTLVQIDLLKGRLRGLNPLSVKFNYPISVFSGKNGSGKSTMLAIAACAFHNRKGKYYTFSDFFIQSKSEQPPDGIKIGYDILNNNWKRSESFPDGVGKGRQTRKKGKGGRWNDYSKRVERNVVFLGIDRVVPQSEKSVYKTYRASFKESEKSGWEEDVKSIVSKILGKDYSDFCYIRHGKYRVPVVESDGERYSGFNMGAGEKALFEVFSIIFESPMGVLIIIDEIELGLHEEAQKKFIKELKQVCLQRKTQIIATTHSKAVLANLPPAARFFIESFKGKTIITDSISASYAAAQMAGENSFELDIFVEDDVAKKILEFALPMVLRNRINIIIIGSSSAISRQLAARYKDHMSRDCIAIMDGDKKDKFNEHLKVFNNMMESIDDKTKTTNWLKYRIEYLPGSTWPEKWVLETIKNANLNNFSKVVQTSNEILKSFIDSAILSEKHSEFFTLGDSLRLEPDSVINLCVQQLLSDENKYFDELVTFVSSKLEGAVRGSTSEKDLSYLYEKI